MNEAGRLSGLSPNRQVGHVVIVADFYVEPRLGTDLGQLVARVKAWPHVFERLDVEATEAEV